VDFRKNLHGFEIKFFLFFRAPQDAAEEVQAEPAAGRQL
jgi:hypothetical protein